MFGQCRFPDYPAALAQIQNLNTEELKEYLNNDDKMDELIKSLDQVKQLYSEKEMLMTSNKSLAEYNLSQEPVLQRQKDELESMHREAMDLVNKVKSVRSELELKAGKVKPETLLSLLEAANAEAEEESEKLAESFLDGKEDKIDVFLEQFQEARKIAHSRRVKIDKMKELLNATPTKRRPPPPSFVQPPPTAYMMGAPSSSSFLPYPTTQMGILPPIPAYPPLPR